MANTYTYDDFLRAMEQSGLGGQFSQADMNLARQNPDAGMSLLSYKTDYSKATTDEARALANQGAESVRSSYGGYTGGGDGGSFKLDPLSPRNFSYDEAPTFTDNWEGRISDALSKTQNRDPYSYSGVAPTYESRYDPQIQQSIQGILGRGEFSYDPKTDPVYSAYQKQYAREGQRATANAMGEAAAMTGGMPSSWAMTAASQAGDYYGAQMADKIPELYQDAYNRYLQEYQMKLSDLNALRGLESDDYQKYQTELSQFNKDRDFDYAAWLDSIKLDQNDLDNLRALRSDDMDLYKTQLGQYNTDRSFNYSQLLDEISNQRTRAQDEWSQAETAAKYGDYSRLNAKGVDTSSAEYADMVARGVQAAQYGDYSLLNQAGIDTSTAQFKEQLAIAQERAAVGDYSGYAALGVDTSNAQLMDALNIQAKQAQINNLNNKGTTGTAAAGTSGLSNAQLLTLAQAQAKRGDYSLLDYLAEQTGVGTDYNAVNEKETVDAAKKAAKEKVTDSGTMADRFNYIKERFAAGDPAVDTREKVEALIESIPGYTKSKYGPKKDELLDELFPADKKSTQTVKPRKNAGSGIVISQT